MNYRGWLLIFFMFVILYSAALHTTATFNDPDSFYHARITELMIERGGIITKFPWLPFTAFSQSFIDHHLLYHAFLVPFIALWGPLWGMKAAAACAFVAVIAAFILLLSRIVDARRDIRRRFLVLIFTASLFLNGVFTTRMNLEKIPALSLLWLLGGTYALVSGKRVLTFFFSFFFVWLHGAWPLMPMLSILYLIADQCSRKALGLCAWSVAGACAGLIINPYFPDNIFFYLVQIFHVAIVTYGDLYEIGAEWYPANAQIISWGTGAVITAASATAVFMFKAAFTSGTALSAKRTTIERFFFAATLVFFFLALKSSRHGEYFVPFATLFGGIMATPFLESLSLKHAKELWKTCFLKRRSTAILVSGIALLYGIFAPILIASNLMAFREDGIPVEKHRYISAWMRQNIPRESMIFNDQWGYFPSVWFWGGDNRFIAGLDPTFFYSLDPNLFWNYEALRKGTVQSGAARAIQRLFGAEAIIVSKENSALRAVLDRDSDATLVYEDGSGSIFTVSILR